MKSHLISAVILMMTFLITGDAQRFSCNYNFVQPLCPGTITQCMCTSTGTSIQWNFTTLDLCPMNFNFIRLLQVAPCSNSSPSSSGTCGPYLSAANNNPTEAGSSCSSSILTITANKVLNGLGIECRDVTTGEGTAIGHRYISIAAPPPWAPTITSLISTYSDQLTVTWRSVPTATSYNVIINDSNNTLVPTLYTQYIFTGLTSNTIYTTSVVAINCAGSSAPVKATGRTGNASPSLPSITTPTPSTTTGTCDSTIGTVIGVSVSVTFVVSFSMGVLVASIFCYISRRFKDPSHSLKKSSHVNPEAVNEVSTATKMKGGVMEMNTNAAYGSHASSTEYDEVGTKKKRMSDAVEMKTNTVYGLHVS